MEAVPDETGFGHIKDVLAPGRLSVAGVEDGAGRCTHDAVPTEFMAVRPGSSPSRTAAQARG